SITQIGKPPPLAVRLEQALPFRRCVGGEDVLGGSPASQTIQKPQAQYHGEARSSGVVPCRVPSLNEECALMHPLQGASFLSTPLQGGILKPPALRVVGESQDPEHARNLATKYGLLNHRKDGSLAPHRERTELEAKLRILGLTSPWS